MKLRYEKGSVTTIDCGAVASLTAPDRSLGKLSFCRSRQFGVIGNLYSMDDQIVLDEQ